MPETNPTENSAPARYQSDGSSRFSRDSREGAPVEVVLRRFFRDVQQSEIMTEIKRRKHYEKSPSRNARRRAAQGKISHRREKRGY